MIIIGRNIVTEYLAKRAGHEGMKVVRSLVMRFASRPMPDFPRIKNQQSLRAMFAVVAVKV